MGGRGSGRPLFSGRGGKDTTESQYRIDIRWLNKQGYLKPGAWGSLSWSSRGKQTGSINYRMESDSMILNFRHRDSGGEWETIQQEIVFDRTPCYFGGYRKWFLCSCGKRVAVLYGKGKYYLCRHCYALTYNCKQEQPVDRLIRKQRKLRSRLGATDDLSEPIWAKPKNMHWKTFERLKNQAEGANRLSWGIMAARFG